VGAVRGRACVADRSLPGWPFSPRHRSRRRTGSSAWKRRSSACRRTWSGSSSTSRSWKNCFRGARRGRSCRGRRPGRRSFRGTPRFGSRSAVWARMRRELPFRSTSLQTVRSITRPAPPTRAGYTRVVRRMPVAWSDSTRTTARGQPVAPGRREPRFSACGDRVARHGPSNSPADSRCTSGLP
jgi:hypothetical protein